jgi:hypothetical protein
VQGALEDKHADFVARAAAVARAEPPLALCAETQAAAAVLRPQWAQLAAALSDAAERRRVACTKWIAVLEGEVAAFAAQAADIRALVLDHALLSRGAPAAGAASFADLGEQIDALQALRARLAHHLAAFGLKSDALPPLDPLADAAELRQHLWEALAELDALERGAGRGGSGSRGAPPEPPLGEMALGKLDVPAEAQRAARLRAVAERAARSLPAGAWALEALAPRAEAHAALARGWPHPPQPPHPTAPPPPRPSAPQPRRRDRLAPPLASPDTTQRPMPLTARRASARGKGMPELPEPRQVRAAPERRNARAALDRDRGGAGRAAPGQPARRRGAQRGGRSRGVARRSMAGGGGARGGAGWRGAACGGGGVAGGERGGAAGGGYAGGAGALG